MEKMSDHKIPMKNKQIKNVLRGPAIVPSQVFFLFHEIRILPYLIPIWLVIKSLIELIPNIAKSIIGGEIKAANICPIAKNR